MNRDKINWDTDMLYTSMYQQRYVDVHTCSMSVSQSHFYAIPILHFKFYLLVKLCGLCVVFVMPTENALRYSIVLLCIKI